LNVKLEYPKDFPPLAKDLVSKVLKKNAQSRIPIKDMREHPWLKIAGTKTPPVQQSPPQSVNTSMVSNPSSMTNLPVSMPSTPKTPTASSQTQLIPPSPHHPDKLSPTAKKKLDDDDVEGFNNDELKIYSSRKESIIHKKGEESQQQNQNGPTKATGAEKLFERFSISSNAKHDDGKQKVIEDLNETVKRLRGDIGEMQAELKLKNNEIASLKKEVERCKTESSNFFHRCIWKSTNN